MFDNIKIAKAKHQEALFARKGVVGCGVGYKETVGLMSPIRCIVVCVEKKKPLGELSPSDVIPREVDGILTDVQETGKFRALRTSKHRPAPGGVSIGHPLVTAGTLGCLMRNADGEICILSNNHVMAASNQAIIGDPIVQPGIYDGGTVAEDQIATLADFVPVKFLMDQLPDCQTAEAVVAVLNRLAGAVGSRHRIRAYQEDEFPYDMNLVDCAIALPDHPSMVTPSIMDIGVPEGTAVGELGMPVIKSGRTTGTTTGTITMVDFTGQVAYGGTDIALFTDQLVTNLPCSGGDSGSVVLSGKNVVGLLFAGGEGITLVNRWEYVRDLLGVMLP